jgi:uncharacterized protein
LFSCEEFFVLVLVLEDDSTNNEKAIKVELSKVDGKPVASILPHRRRGRFGCGFAALCSLATIPCNRVLSGNKTQMRKRRLLSAREETALLREVEVVYEELANRPVERSCVARTHCCRFKLTGEIPYVTRGEAMLVARSWRATGRKIVEESPHPDGRCPFLDPGDQRCRIYSVRPFACRTHFCAAAGGPYRRSEVLDLIRRLEDIDQRLGGTGGPRPLVPAVSDALGK